MTALRQTTQSRTLLLFAAFSCQRVEEPPPAKDERSKPVERASGFAATVLERHEPESAPPEGMVWIPGGEFSMGSSDPRAGGHCHEPMSDARPIHRVAISGFFMDRTEVTNAEFARFVAATHYVTVAERAPTAEEMPGVPASERVPGSSVFSPTAVAVPLDQPLRWWRYVAHASWKRPDGPGSSLEGRSEHPVVHVGYEDAVAYADWAGKQLPTEAEWEFAARGGRTGKLYPWGDELTPAGQYVANIYQGDFPVAGQDRALDGFAGSAPVGSYPPNDFGLYDMAGNVWEWVADYYRSDTYARRAGPSVLRDPAGPDDSYDPAEPRVKKRVQRGGSFLCTSDYCTRYMVGTRGKAEPRSPTNHVGFRCVKRVSGATVGARAGG